MLGSRSQVNGPIGKCEAGYRSCTGNETPHLTGRVTSSGSSAIAQLRLGIFWAFALWASVPAVQADPPQLPVPKQAEYRIAIHCSLKVLQLWYHDTLVREYPIRVGKGGLWRTRVGDHRTPIGDYEITWMASRNSRKGHRIVEEKSWCKGNRFVYASSGPALERLWSKGYGGQYATVMSINYPNAADKARGHTGECIHIHATHKLVYGELTKSHGCIHMFPKDAMELYELVDVGTPVKILP